MAITSIKEMYRTKDQYDYVDNLSGSVLTKDAPLKRIMVESAEDIEGLTGYAPGSIAYTTDGTLRWMMSTNGTWVAITSTPW